MKDACAGAVAACGLLELSKVSEGKEAREFFDAALNILKALNTHCTDWSNDDPAILIRCTGSYHGNDHHIAMTYADFFFIEAVLKLHGDTFLFW